MEDLRSIVQYTIKYDRNIRKICSPLTDCLGIPFFTYYSIDQKGNFTILSNYPEQEDFFYSEKLYLTSPYLTAPDLMRSGAILVECTPDSNYLDMMEQRFKMHDVFLILEKHDDSLEGYIFSVKSNDSRGPTVYLNNFELLKKFGRYFIKEAEPIIGKMKADRYNLVKAKGQAFWERDLDEPLSSTTNSQIQNFLKAISPLSLREHQCLDLFLQGKTAQATAEILGLSRHTVEHYFENIKNKLGCLYKKDLLDR